MSQMEAVQRDHYNRLIDSYERHYDDPTSQRYRRRFLYEPLFAGLPLRDADVLEAMCGSGQTTGYLLEQGARACGLDLSDHAVELYRSRWPGCEARAASVLDTGYPDESFDGVAIIGGLHHVHPRVQDAVDEVHRILRPGGWFGFGEPHAGSLPDSARRMWYRADKLFEEGEAAVDVRALYQANRDRFDLQLERYTGGPAYLFVLNSMVWRIPVWLKPAYASPLMALERLTDAIGGRRYTCFALCRWRKKA